MQLMLRVISRRKIALPLVEDGSVKNLQLVCEHCSNLLSKVGTVRKHLQSNAAACDFKHSL